MNIHDVVENLMYGEKKEDIHIFTSLTKTETLCGKPGKSMSWHEIKRGRITCVACLKKYPETIPAPISRWRGRRK